MELISSPSLAAGVVIRNDAGRVLLVHQNYGGRKWTLPGGMLEAGEGPAKAAVREVREETGLEVELTGLVGAYYLKRRKPGVRFLFRGEVLHGGVPFVRDDELDDLGWFDPDSLPAELMPALPAGIQDAVEGRIGLARTIDADGSPGHLSPEGATG